MACRKRCWLREAGCGCLLADCWPAGGRHLLSSGMACRDYGGAVAGGSQGPSVNSWVRASRGSMPHLAASPGVLSPLHDVAVKRFTESFCNTSAKCCARWRSCSEPSSRGPATCATPLTIVGDELPPLRPARSAGTHAMPVLHPERRRRWTGRTGRWRSRRGRPACASSRRRCASAPWLGGRRVRPGWTTARDAEAGKHPDSVLRTPASRTRRRTPGRGQGPDNTDLKSPLPNPHRTSTTDRPRSQRATSPRNLVARLSRPSPEARGWQLSRRMGRRRTRGSGQVGRRLPDLKSVVPHLRPSLVPSIGSGCKLGCMSEPARDLPVSSPAVEEAVELARHGVITHLTIHGERVAAIVPESVLDALRAAEDAEAAAEAEAAMDEPGDSIPLEELEAEFGL